MATRQDFTAVEWQALRNAPQLVALATAAAGNSGLFGSLSEGMATASAIAEALRGNDPLLREVFARDDIRAAQDEIRTGLKSVTDRAALNQYLQESAVTAVTAALAALQARGTAADVVAYGAFIKGISAKVANASTEGGFLGFGGERLSASERQFLAALDTTVGHTPA